MRGGYMAPAWPWSDSDDVGHDAPMPDAEPPFRLMSYRGLAEVWGCSLEAAQERVRRHKWRKQPGNSRQVLVAVPLHVLEEAVGDGDPRVSMDLREEVRAQRERELQGLRERAERAEAAAQAAQEDVVQARRDADRAQGEAAGLREAVRVAEEAVRRTEMARLAAEGAAVEARSMISVEAGRTAEAERRAAQEGARAAAAEDRMKDAVRRAEEAEEARRAFLAAPWWRRLMGRP